MATKIGTVAQEIENLLKLEKSLCEDECSEMMEKLQTSGEVLYVVDLHRYITSFKEKLIPAVRHCRKFRAGADFSLSATNCDVIASALTSDPSHLKELDLWGLWIDSGVEILFDGLRSPNCQVKTLRLRDSGFFRSEWDSLVSLLKSNTSHLTKLDLRGSSLRDAAKLRPLHLCVSQVLDDLVKDPENKLQTVKWTWNGETSSEDSGEDDEHK